MLMDDRKAIAEAVEVARATVDATPAEPPTWQYARAISAYANTLLSEDDYTIAREQAERGRAVARAAERAMGGGRRARHPGLYQQPRRP